MFVEANFLLTGNTDFFFYEKYRISNLHRSTVRTYVAIVSQRNFHNVLKRLLLV